MQVGLGSLSESLTSVMESHGVAEGVLVVVPDGLSTDVDLVVSIFPDETSSFLSNGIEVNGSGGYAISVLHGDLADFLGLVSSLFLFPDNVLHRKRYIIIEIKSDFSLLNLPCFCWLTCWPFCNVFGEC